LMVWVNEYFSSRTKMWMTVDKNIGDIEDMVTRDSSGQVAALKLPSRAILIVNHQIYADWLYIWCISYLANMHGALKIILKDSFKWLPVFGWGMQFFDFIFLSRKWAKDKIAMSSNLRRASKNVDQAMWLLLFPEGTVVSQNTMHNSKEYAEKNGLKMTTYTLIPRSTGLNFCVNNLRNSSIEYLYDFTLGYEGIVAGEIPEQVYTLHKIYFESRGPTGVHVHLRRFRVADLPNDEEAFAKWLNEVWAEKDALMAEFYARGRFPVGGEVGLEKKGMRADSLKEEGRVQLPIRLHSLLDLTQIWFYLIPYVPIVHVLKNWLFSGSSLSSLFA